MSKRNKHLIKKIKTQSGARNLILLGLASTLIAVMTTSVALAIYHNSGDIYLDRSRPGYLPDEQEIEKDEDKKDDAEEYDFSRDGVVDEAGLGEFLKHLNEEVKAIDEFEKPFSNEVLTDDYLGIPVEKKTEDVTPEEVTEEAPVAE